MESVTFPAGLFAATGYIPHHAPSYTVPLPPDAPGFIESITVPGALSADGRPSGRSTVAAGSGAAFVNTTGHITESSTVSAKIRPVIFFIEFHPLLKLGVQPRYLNRTVSNPARYTFKFLNLIAEAYVPKPTLPYGRSVLYSGSVTSTISSPSA